MDLTTNSRNNKLSKEEIIFPSNGNKAILVKLSVNESTQQIINALELGSYKPKLIILVFGGATGSLDTSSTSVNNLFPILDSILQYASDNDALIIDGGTQAGIMELLGQRAKDLDPNKKPVLLGIAPMGRISLPESIDKKNDDKGSKHDKAELDPNHTHFVLVEGNEWGDETMKIFEIASASSFGDIPVVALLAGGGKISKKEVIFCIDRKWPIIAIENTGYLADEIASYKNQKETNQNRLAAKINLLGRRLRGKAKTKAPQHLPNDVQLRKIVSYPSLHFFPSDANRRNQSLDKFLLYIINYDPLLEDAWQNMALYDKSAKNLQRNFNRFQKSILGIGVLTTLLAIIQTQYNISPVPFDTIAKPILTVVPITISFEVFRNIPYYILIILPLTISILIAALNRFRYGAKWVLIRAAAEAIKSEIYQYRTISSPCEQKQEKDIPLISPKEKLSNSISFINSSLMKTDISLHGLYEYKGPLPPEMYGAAENDDGYSKLSEEQYIKIRIDDQISYYQKTAFKLEKQLKILQWLILLSGGAGAFLAAVHFQILIALTTTLVATFVSFLEYKQIENTLIKYNQSRTELYNIKLRWQSLSKTERGSCEKKDMLIQKTEDVLRTELSGWIRQMQVTLEKLHSKKETANEDNTSGNNNA